MRSWLVMLSCVALTSCATSNVEVPSELKTAGKQAAIKWSKSLGTQDPIAFAPFKTSILDISWASGSSSGFSVGGIGGGSQSTEQTYKFTMTKDGSKVEAAVACKKTGSQSGLAIGGVSMGDEKSVLDCSFGEGGRIFSEAGAGKGLTGIIQGLKVGDAINFTPVFTDDTGKASSAVLGYSFGLKGKTVATINLGQDKSYWYIAQDEANDVNLAAAATALMLYHQ